MPATFDDARTSLTRARESLDLAHVEVDPAKRNAHVKICLHAIAQAARLAHRTYEIRCPFAGSEEGGTRTWAKEELVEFMRVPHAVSARCNALLPESITGDCELWLKRAKFFVDRLAAESSLTARRVDEVRVERTLLSTGKVKRWEEKDGELIDRTE